MARICIIMGTYNGAGYLEPQVQSIREQSLHAWKLLVRDDGSKDATVAAAISASCAISNG